MTNPEYNPLTSSEDQRHELDDCDTSDNDDNNELIIEDTTERVKIIILDSAQQKFFVSVNPDWSVNKLKIEGERIHKVPPTSQRLIYRGKMLDDSKLLRDAGIDKDNLILHLFPKPRVVVTTSSSNITENSTGSDDDNGSGAHVPQIILDEDEQERRGQILVLGSAEINEAQNNVKLLSLLLLVVCSMRLLALFSIAMGVSEEPSMYTDDTVPPDIYTNHTGFDDDAFNTGTTLPKPRHWQNSDYFDLLVSALGFYVSLLGMKATTENTLRLATAYMIGVLIAGIGWNIWNIFMYAIFVKEESEIKNDSQQMPLDTDDFITVAFFTVMMPCLVWCLCFARAWEFRRLIEEAELEAAERIQSQLTVSDETSSIEQNIGDQNDRQDLPIV